MRPAEKLSITLPAEMARMVRKTVQRGTYASNSEVIREALRVWEERESERERRLSTIRKKIDEALKDPRRLNEAEVEAHFKALHRKTKKARARAT
ncbi:MAG TPA: type II toxin-antitoxin system ParD family antitoxin [Xanthobacteraceae bacterium]|nr:type II toxin-antitoxin system ParD family antitoxin [Xanthobacteraceae bacterium]